MKTKFTLVLFILCSFTFSQAQTVESSESPGSVWGGIAGSLNKFVDKFELSMDANEAMRWMAIYNSDIRMWMQEVPGGAYQPAFDKGAKGRSAGGSIYAEFDWDNLAEKMIVDGGEPYTAYTDKHGFMYFPYENIYLKINPKNAIQENALQIFGVALELSELVQLHLDKFIVVSELLRTVAGRFSGTTNPLYKGIADVYPTLAAFVNGRGIVELTSDLLDQLAREKFSSIVGFPVFVHWALMYSPDLLKSKFSVTETTVDCPDGSGNNCTKCTVASGKEKGKSMTFDQYGRLIYIDAKKDGNVKYAYDKDLTVNVPRALTFKQLIGLMR